MANTANISNNTLTTDLSVAPYYDDFDANKEYYRFLFKPGYAVQARELTQMQTMLQDQIRRFGTHVFDEGSIVIPGAFTFYSSVNKNPIYYVKIKDLDSANKAVQISDFLNQKVTGLTTSIDAEITDVLEGSESSANTKTIYVKYNSVSPANSQIKAFQNDEVLTCNVGTLIVSNTANSTGLGSKFGITEGVFFAKNHFISFPGQSIILDRYNSNPTCKVGFLVKEKIVSASDDSSLLDPALESSNYSAPGADRLQLDPVLHIVPFTDPIGPPDFVTLFTIKEGVVQTVFQRPQYNILQSELAKRTYDESGDYYVNGLNVQVLENKDTGVNFGKYNYPTANTDLLYVGVESGTAYVRGYEVNIQPGSTYPLDTPKSKDYANVNAQISSAIMGSYISVNEFVGAWEFDKGNPIDLYDTAQKRISTKQWSAPAQTGNKIGSAKIVSLEYINGVPGYDAVYDIYLTDINMLGSNTFSSVKSLYYDNGGNIDPCADVILDPGTFQTILNDSAQFPLMYYVGSDYTRKIRSISDENLSDTSYNFYRTSGISSSITVSTSGTFSVTLPAGDERFTYGTVSDISRTNKQELILSFNSGSNVALNGWSVSANAGNGDTTTLTGNASCDFTRFNIGDKIEITGYSNTFFITGITGTANLTVSETLPVGISGNGIYKVYKTGDIVDIDAKGVKAGNTRTVAATPTTLTIDLKEDFPSTFDAVLTYRVEKSSAYEVPKILRTSRYVAINCATHVNGTTGPYSLGVADVYKIKSITQKDGSIPTNTTDGSDVTGSFKFDNGQRDTQYDLAEITPRIPLTSSTRLLVCLDYFAPDYSTRSGYFSVDSYPIEDTSLFDATYNIRTENIPVYRSPTSGLTYDLRNYLDFRPVKSSTWSSDGTTVALASVNPSSTSTFAVPSLGLRLPIPSNEITYDYSYYLGRKDLVIATTSGSFSIIKGIPAATPITPTNIPENSMVIAILTIPPYPSLSPPYAQSLGIKSRSVRVQKVAPIRYTMRDIGVLKSRIENLEYYTQLTLLEKAAADMMILDEFGIDRFKNGIFVDTFNDHSLGVQDSNPDYRIVVDQKEKSIRPLYDVFRNGYKVLSNTNIVINNNLMTLDFSETEFLSVTPACTTRNIERSSYLYLGTLTLTPPEDDWIDVYKIPDENLYGNGAVITNSPEDTGTPTGNTSVLLTTWEAWKKYVTGYNVYKIEKKGQQTLVGTYATEAEANKKAQQYKYTNDVKIETKYTETRTGTQLFATEFAASASTGYKIVDISEIPYIRPQTIYGYGRGLKPYSKLHTFFDGTNVDFYTTPLDQNTYDILVESLTDANTNVATSNVTTANEGSTLLVSSNGSVYFSFRIDSIENFRTGTKQLILTDSPTNEEIDASTGALAYFHASALKVTKQRTTFTTKNMVEQTRDVNESRDGSSVVTIKKTPRPSGGGCCFDPNTLVTMADGSKKKIIDIKPGQKVLAGDGKKVNLVVQVLTPELLNRKMYKFNNTWAFVSEEHAIMSDKGWSAFNPDCWAVEEEFKGELAKIEIGTKLLKGDGSWEEVKSIESVDASPSTVIYTLSLEDDHTFIAEDYVVHNNAPRPPAPPPVTSGCGGGSPPPRTCFDPDALVTMADGSLTKIADIKVGDKVLSGNNKDVNTVLDITTHPLLNNKMYKFNDNWAFVSESHPLLSDKGWAAFNPESSSVDYEFIGKLSKIEVGSKLKRANGSWEEVKSIEAVELDSSYIIYNLMLDGDHTYIVQDYVVHNKKSCMAYSFFVNAPDNEEGIFITGGEIFIEQKDPDNSIWFEIREMDNSGNITKNQVPGTEVWIKSEDVPLSTDGKTNPLIVKFPAPVFLLNRSEYAFVIHTENVSKDYYIWIARLKLPDVTTQVQYTDRPLTGTFYTTNNNTDWDIIPDTDLTCKLYRAAFVAEGSAVIGNRPTEKILFSSVSKSLNQKIGTMFISGNRLGIANVSGVISVGNYIRGNNSLVQSRVISLVSANKYSTANTGFVIGEGFVVYDSNNLNPLGVTGDITSVECAQAYLSDYQENSRRLLGSFVASSGGFRANDVIFSIGDQSYKGIISKIDNTRYSTVSFEPISLNFFNTSLTYQFQTYSNTGIEGLYESFAPSETHYFNDEKALYSRSNEILNLGSKYSNQIKVNMSTQSEYVSPLLDLDRTSTIYVDNLINSNTSGETNSSGGGLINRYISKVVTLAENQDAEDVRVTLTSYRPPSTDVLVWIRIQHAEDEDIISQRNWIPLERTPEGDTTFSSLSDRDDFKEYTYTVPALYANTETRIIKYTNSKGTTFEGFKYFAVKIGLVNTQDNSAIIPRVADLRVIALQR